MDILHIASGTLTVFFILLLLSKQERGLANSILIGWFAVILSGIVASYIVSKELPAKFFFLELADSLSFLHGPFLWFYTLALTRNHFHFRRADAIHLLPFLLSLLLFVVPHLAGRPVPDTRRHAAIILKFVLILGYAIAGLRQWYRYDRELPEILSSPEKYRLRWLGVIISGILLVWLVGVISLSAYLIGDFEIPDYGGWYTNATLSGFVLILGYFGFRHTPIFIPEHFLDREKLEESAGPPPEKNSGKYSKSGLDEETASRYFQLLKEYMDRHRPYLDSQLTLFQLAEALQISPNHLSQVINTFFQQNFFDFINGYRVEEVKKKIMANAHQQHTLLGIALDCGFYSKASFNRAFKKFTGMTPSGFCKEVGENV